MKKLLLNKYILYAVVALCGGIIYSTWSLKNKHHSDQKKTTAIVQLGEIIQRSSISGTIAPLRKTIITAPYQGYVKKVYIKLGQVVKAGDPIASVAPTLASGDAVFPLRAPFAGKVVQLNKAEGEFVKAADATDFIARVDDMSKLYVDSNIPELDRAKMKSGLEATIKASAILDRTYMGIVRELTFAAREDSRYGMTSTAEFPMRLEVLDFDDQLRPGMSVIVDIVTMKKQNVLTLRHEFIGADKGSYFVTLANGKRKKIGIGIQNEEYSEIISGIEPGAVVQKVDFSVLNGEQ